MFLLVQLYRALYKMLHNNNNNNNNNIIIIILPFSDGEEWN